MTDQITGAQSLVRSLERAGVDVVFGIPGGAILPAYDPLMDSTQVRHILTRHEQGAGHAAEGYAAATGRVGVCMATSGPGATNLVTPIADAYMDSVPIVAITGQVPSAAIGTDAFQEADIRGITMPITKHNFLVTDPAEIPSAVAAAFHIAATGRPGPVLVDIAKDALQARTGFAWPEQIDLPGYRPVTRPHAKQVREAARMIVEAKRPVLYVGGGVIRAGAHAELRRLAELTGIPVTTTLMARGAFPDSHPLHLGMPGMHGTVAAVGALQKSDLIIALGARFDDRVTGRLDGFSPHSKKIHVDIDPSSINKSVGVDVAIVGDAEKSLEALAAAWRRRSNTIARGKIEPWWAQIQAWRRKDSYRFRQNGRVIKPQTVVRRLYEATRHLDTYVTTDVGQHQMWAAQHFPFDQPLRWMTSGGLGTMGYGFPAALGVQMAHPDATVVCISGDASWVMNMQEMSTAMQYRLPVKTFILNNSYMGMVRQWQDFFHGNRHAESYMDSLPDFVKLAEAFGAVGLRATSPSEVDDLIKEALRVQRPVLADIVVDRAENVYPMIPGGAAHNEIRLSPDEDEATPVKGEEGGMVLV